MGGLVIETVRPGVQFTPPAAASFRRLEARLGRKADVNRTYADYDTQLRMYNAWQAWVTGRGPKPNHSRALHPEDSVHCRGEAWDTDEWLTPGFIPLAAEYGWIRTAAGDPTEQHHFEYQSWRDQHRNGPVPTGTPTAPPKPLEEDEMLMLNITGLGATHKVALGVGVFRHFVGGDPYEKIKNVSRIQDDWQDISAAELPAFLRTYGCDLRIWDVRDGQFVVLDPITGNVGPGNAWTASGAVRAAVAGIKLPAVDPAPVVAAVREALTQGRDLTAEEIAEAVRDRFRAEPLS